MYLKWPSGRNTTKKFGRKTRAKKSLVQKQEQKQTNNNNNNNNVEAGGRGGVDPYMLCPGARVTAAEKETQKHWFLEQTNNTG